MVTTRKFNKLVVRFRRRGHIRYAIYEIILTTQNMRSRGAFLEKLGFFNPQFNERLFFTDSYRLVYWVMRGAYVNRTVKKYLVKLLV